MTDRPPTHRRTEADRHVERLDGETIVYDVATDVVLRLAPDATAVWDACTSGASVRAIAGATGLGPARIDQALAALNDAGLVESSDGLTRRQFARRIGAGAAVVSGLALVTSIAAPTPASAASSSGSGGGTAGGGCDTPDCAGG